MTTVLKPAVPTAADTVYFVELLLRQNGNVVDRNVYWLPTTPDVIDWANTIGNPQATITSYAEPDRTAEPAGGHGPATATPTGRAAGPGGADRRTTVTITNNSTTPYGRLLPAGRHPARHLTGRELPGDNELQSSTVERQRRHPVAGRVPDHLGHLALVRPEGRRPRW